MIKFQKVMFLSLLVFLLVGQLTASRIKPYGDNGRVVRQTERADSLTGFDITKYEITLNINQQTHFIQGNVLAHVTSESNLTAIEYNLIGLTVSEVRVNNTVTTFTHQNGIIHIPVSFNTGQTFTTQVFYSGVPQLSNDIYHIGMIWGNNMVFTISDPDASRYWWPCYDHPWDKAIVDFHITIRSDWLVACNGIRHSIVDNGNGTKTHHWLGSNPMATYLACITAGPYVEINQMAGNLPIKNFVFQNQYNAALTDFSTLPQIIDYFSSIFGAYPFEKYGHALVNMTTYGAMEHQTMTTLGMQYITGNHGGELVIAHELAHQWYGNCLTPLTFADVWLSEGFATYSEMLWLAKRDGWIPACNYVNTSYHNYYITWENQAGPQIIYNPSFNNYFAPQSYEKAASVLHMLRLKMGDQNFFQLLNNWFMTYHNGNVITAEFKALAESISNIDLDQFFLQWIYQAGIPSVEYWTFTNDSTNQVKILAKTNCSTGTFFYLDIPIRIPTNGIPDSLTIIASPTGYSNVLQMLPSHAYDQIVWDPNHWVLIRQQIEYKPYLNTALPGSQSVILEWNPFNCPLPISGYRIYRRANTNPQWTMIGQTGLQTTYVDNGVIPGTTYEYRITALTNDGFQTVPSNVISVTPLNFAFDLGMLLVDETRDGNGQGLYPTDAMVDSFYNQVLEGLNYNIWDCVAMGLPSLNTLSHYNLVVWHSDDFNQILINDALSNLSSYLLAGGKLVVSGWKTPISFTNSFLNNFMPNTSLLYDNIPSLISAQSINFPELYVNPSNLPSAWNGCLSMIYTFPGAENVLYTANMTTNSLGNGNPIAVRYDDSGTLVLFGFPLYYMQPEGVRNMFLQLLPSLFQGVGNDDSVINKPDLSLVCYPNPMVNELHIKVKNDDNLPHKVHIYNVKGQKVISLLPQAIGPDGVSYIWYLNTEQKNQFTNGIYFITINNGNKTITRKIVLIK